MKQINLCRNTFVIYKLETNCLTKSMPIMHIVRHETRLNFNLWLKYLSATIGCSKCIVHSCNKCYRITVLPIRPHSFNIFASHTLSLSLYVFYVPSTHWVVLFYLAIIKQHHVSRRAELTKKDQRSIISLRRVKITHLQPQK